MRGGSSGSYIQVVVVVVDFCLDARYDCGKDD